MLLGIDCAARRCTRALPSTPLCSALATALGDLPFETNAAHLFFQLISRRYERGSVLKRKFMVRRRRGALYEGRAFSLLLTVANQAAGR
jgi:hypothetical protein